VQPVEAVRGALYELGNCGLIEVGAGTALGFARFDLAIAGKYQNFGSRRQPCRRLFAINAAALLRPLPVGRKFRGWNPRSTSLAGNVRASTRAVIQPSTNRAAHSPKQFVRLAPRTPMTWTVREIERDRGTITAIELHDDRSAAILAGAYLEDRLMATIQARLVSHPQPEQPKRRLSFLEKIDFALSLGIYEERIAQILHVVRKIRNEFAHNLDPITFDSPEIVLLCKPCFDVDSFRVFETEVAPDINGNSQIRDLTDAFTIMGNAANTTRNAYLNTVKAMLLILELMKATFMMGEDHYLEIIRGKLCS
jgi:hypothetical protein